MASHNGDDASLRKVVDELTVLVDGAGGAQHGIRPIGYEHLGLVVLDAIYSLRANYDIIVIPLINRVRDTVRLDSAEGPASPASEFDAARLRSWIASLTDTERRMILNNQKSPGTSILKSTTCIEVADVLVDARAGTCREFRTRCEAERQGYGRGTLGASLRSVRGVGPAAWRYMINLVGLPSVKPDTMVMRWLEGVTGASRSPDEAAELVEAASATLMSNGIALDARATDHLIWRVQSGRPITFVGREQTN